MPRSLPQGRKWRNLANMSERPKQQQAKRRRQRLSVALRQNLKRRKAQARQRRQSGASAGAAEGVPHDSAGFPGDRPEDEGNRN
jgi:hypothetical protein